MAIRNTTINRGLNGLNPLSYMGDNPTTPPDFYSISRDPGPMDWQDFMLCDLWLNTTNQNVWVLVSLNNNQATWVMLAGGGFGPILGVLVDNGVIAHAIGGVIDLFAQTQAGGTVTFTASTNVIRLNTTDANGNTSIGLGSGASITVATTSNTFLGLSSGAKITANANTLIGYGAGLNITTGANNTGIGTAVLNNLITGSNNTVIGNFAGTNYTGAESSNILVGSAGILGESNAIHIGTNGSGLGEQNTTNLDGGNIIVTTGSFNTVVGSITAGGNGTVRTTNSSIFAGSTSIVPTIFSSLATLRNRAGGAVALGDGLGAVVFFGFDGTDYTTGASVGSTVDNSGTIALNRVPANLVFSTHPNAALANPSAVSVRMIISSAGNVTIQAPDSGVALNSIGTFGQAVGASGTAVFVDNAGNFGTSVSSRRFKENIQDMNSDSSDILNLRPVTFDYINDSRPDRQYGLIAEEVYETMPQLVSFDKDGLVQTVKYHDLVPMLLNEIQKLNKRVEQLEQK